MKDWIRVLIVDDIEDTRTNIRKILSFDQRIEVVGEAENGLIALELAQKYQPDVILMDINMPEMDGIQATEQLVRKVPKASIIMISVQGETDYLKSAMLAGAKEFVIKPFAPDDLINTIVKVYTHAQEQMKDIYAHQLLEEGVVSSPKVLTIYSGSGGTGKTSIAVNLSLALGETGKKVALIDLDLLFGDIASYLDIVPKRTIYHVVQEIDRLDSDGLKDALFTYSEKVHVLTSPLQPEQSEYIQARQIERMIRLLKEQFDYILIDTPCNYSDTILTSFDLSDFILLISNRSISSVKNNKRVLDVLRSLNVDLGKIRSIINESTNETGISLGDIKGVLGLEEYVQFPEEKLITASINQGKPLLELNKHVKWSKQIQKLATRVLEENERKERRRPWFKMLA